MDPAHSTPARVWCLLALFFFLLPGSLPADDGAVTLKLFLLDGHAFVDAADLEQQAGVAVKTLPGQEALVLCREERCSLVREFRREDGKVWIDVKAMAGALGLKADVDEAGGTVQLALDVAAASTPDGDADLGVGVLVPDLRLARLEGGAITLSELRGKRVLINSWASW